MPFPCKIDDMTPAPRNVALLRDGLFGLAASVLALAPALAEDITQNMPCTGELATAGRVAAIIDARTMRLQDGREIRLAGVEAHVSGVTAGPAQQAALAQLIGERDLTLRGSTKPDRYGRLSGFAFVSGRTEPVQAALVEQGHLAVTAPVDDACATTLLRREASARQARRGIWAEPAALKNAEMPDDILPLIGQFVVVEGRVLSVREAGATLYINFGRRWTQDFAVTISRRNVAGFEAAGVPVKSLARKKVLVRGWIEKRGGPRLHISWPGQIEVLDRS